jgi:hypothetical protein
MEPKSQIRKPMFREAHPLARTPIQVVKLYQSHTMKSFPGYLWETLSIIRMALSAIDHHLRHLIITSICGKKQPWSQRDTKTYGLTESVSKHPRHQDAQYLLFYVSGVEWSKLNMKFLTSATYNKSSTSLSFLCLTEYNMFIPQMMASCKEIIHEALELIAFNLHEKCGYLSIAFPCRLVS